VEGVRKILVPLVLGQGDLLRRSMNSHRDVPSPALRKWYGQALGELDAVCGLVARRN
jgi:hypothetical protein